jgi:hypothetical protein
MMGEQLRPSASLGALVEPMGSLVSSGEPLGLSVSPGAQVEQLGPLAVPGVLAKQVQPVWVVPTAGPAAACFGDSSLKQSLQ